MVSFVIHPGCSQAAASTVQEAPAAAQQAGGGGEQKKLWGGRFTGATDPLMEKFNESLPFDKRMWREDLRVCLPSATCALAACL